MYSGILILMVDKKLSSLVVWNINLAFLQVIYFTVYARTWLQYNLSQKLQIYLDVGILGCGNTSSLGPNLKGNVCVCESANMYHKDASPANLSSHLPGCDCSTLFIWIGKNLSSSSFLQHSPITRFKNYFRWTKFGQPILFLSNTAGSNEVKEN